MQGKKKERKKARKPNTLKVQLYREGERREVRERKEGKKRRWVINRK